MEGQQDLPRISVITVSYNSVRTIERTICSVINQTYSNIEYIIIDGGSTDGTLEVIKKYADKIDYWISEPDRGIYDAMNKGIKRSTGKWLYFLGCDDVLLDNKIFEKVSMSFDDGYFMLFGDVIYDSGKIFKSSVQNILFRNTIHHQGTFYNRMIFKNFAYNEDYKILGDYDLNLYAYKSFPYKRINEIISICGDGGISKQVLMKGYIEEIKIRIKYYNYFISIPLSVVTVSKYCVKKIFKHLAGF